MFLIDDLFLKAPARGLMWLGREITEAVAQEQSAEIEATRAQLSELYMELEAGRIDEVEFDRKEEELLDRLEALEGVDETEDFDLAERFDGEDEAVDLDLRDTVPTESDSQER